MRGGSPPDEAEDGRTLTMLVFSYRIGGVDYECSQDITEMRDVVDATHVRAGFPCYGALPARQSAKQHRGGEEWTGLRDRLPSAAFFDDP